MADDDIRSLLRRARDGDPTARLSIQAALGRRGEPPDQAWEGLPLSRAIDWQRPRAPVVQSRAAIIHDPEPIDVTDPETVRSDLVHLDAERLLAGYPRDESGRLPLGESILLARYETAHREGLARPVPAWLVAASPARRRDPQVVTLRLIAFRGEHEPYRWHETRWLWDARAEASDRTLFGVDGVGEALEAARKKRKAAESACAKGTASAAARIALCLLLQDEGRLVEALALYGVELGPSAKAALEGRHFGEALGHPDLPWEDHARPDWKPVMEEALGTCAPWRFSGALARAKAARKKMSLRLLPLPRGGGQMRKPALLLSARDRDPEKPLLDVEWTASAAQLAEAEWRRPRVPGSSELQPKAPPRKKGRPARELLDLLLGHLSSPLAVAFEELRDLKRLFDKSAKIVVESADGVETRPARDLAALLMSERFARMKRGTLLPGASDAAAEETFAWSSDPADDAGTVRVESGNGGGIHRAVFRIRRKAPTAVVPALTGRPYEEGRRAVEREAFAICHAGSTWHASPEGTIVTQSPPAGSTMGRGWAVALVTSQGGADSEGERLVYLVSLDGLPLGEARARLQALGLEPGETREVPAEGVTRGTVVATEPPGGSDVLVGARVVIITSS